MQVYHFTEQPYYPAWKNHQGSLRVNLPNSVCDPKLAGDLLHRYYDEWKIADRETRDIVDIWSLLPAEFNALAYHDPKFGEHDYKNLPEAESLAAARNREAYARLAWSPYMHNPKLKNRLHRVALPTLFLWGTADRILSESYGRGYCALVPGARFETIEGAGHFPHLEQPDEFARRVLGFAQAPRQAEPRSRRA